MSLLDTLDPILIPWAQKLYDLAKLANVHPKITSARRTYAQQAALYKAYQEGRSRYPALPPGTSAHEWGLAFDMIVPNPTDQADLGTVWVGWRGVYGGSYDPIHYEYPGFSPPTVGTIPSDQTSQVPASSDSTRMFEQVVDLIFQIVPAPLRGILNIAVISSQLASIFGSDVSAGATWMLTHPAELARFAAVLIQDAWSRLIFGSSNTS